MWWSVNRNECWVGIPHVYLITGREYTYSPAYLQYYGCPHCYSSNLSSGPVLAGAAALPSLCLRRYNSATYGWDPDVATLHTDTPPHHPCINTAQAGATVRLRARARTSSRMSDMEDDFMCDDEEDYDLVFALLNSSSRAPALTVALSR